MRFVLIDRLLELSPGHRAVAARTFPEDADFLADHFPGLPLVPGVLLVEAMGQTAGWLLAASSGFQAWPLLALVEHARFRRPVAPGCEVRLHAQVESASSAGATARTEARVDGVRVADARLYFHLRRGQEAGPAFADWTRTTFRELGGVALLP